MLSTYMFFWWQPQTVGGGGGGSNDQTGMLLGMNQMAFNRHMLWALGSILALEISRWMHAQRLLG